MILKGPKRALFLLPKTTSISNPTKMLMFEKTNYFLTWSVLLGLLV